MSEGTLTAEANRLYWETDISVADIAERFDLSRRGLYEEVRPYPTGHPCPACDGELRFENRSARRDGQATCAGCGATTTVAEDEGTSTAAVPDAPADLDVRPDARAVAGAEDARRSQLRDRAVILGGAALAGVALGTVAVLLARRRD